MRFSEPVFLSQRRLENVLIMELKIRSDREIDLYLNLLSLMRLSRQVLHGLDAKLMNSREKALLEFIDKLEAHFDAVGSTSTTTASQAV